MSESRDRLQQPMQFLVQSPGWKEGVMLRILERLHDWDGVSMNGTLEVQVRLEAIAMRRELIELVSWVYQVAGMESPLVAHTEALVMGLRGGRVVERIAGSEPRPPLVGDARSRRRGAGGSVA